MPRNDKEPERASNQMKVGRVLIVDDDRINRQVLRKPLEINGHTVEEAEDGEQALQAVFKHPPDVILLDLMMPNLDGFEVCRRLKADAHTAHIPILIITALSQREERIKGIEAGANDYLTKPVDVQELVLRVHNAIYTKHLFDQLQAEQKKSEQLLLNVLPEAIAKRMKQGEIDIADQHSDVTVLLAQLVGFTELSFHIAPEQVVYLLNEVFSAFDVLVEKRGLEKIKTVGGTYIVAAGVPLPQPDHAEAIAELALEMQEEIRQFNNQYNTSINLRVRITTGPVVAGIIGRRKFAYDLWGNTVNLAWHLQSSGQAASIQVAESSYERLKDKFKFATPSAEVRNPLPATAYELCGRLSGPAGLECT